MMSAKMERSDAAALIWDVIVIGAGPAGSLAALCLAKAGLRTLLVERRSFPRIKVCGGCINGRSVKILDSVGLGNLVRSLPARPVSQLRLRSAHRSLTLPLPGGWAISRGLFDAALANEAAKAGAMFLDGVSAQVATPARLDGSDSAAVRGVHLRDHAGIKRELVFMGVGPEIEVWESARHKSEIGNAGANYPTDSREVLTRLMP